MGEKVRPRSVTRAWVIHRHVRGPDGGGTAPMTYGQRVGRALTSNLALGDQVKRSSANRDIAIDVRVVRDLRGVMRGVGASERRAVSG